MRKGETGMRAPTSPTGPGARRGKLKIFFSYANGAGKTRAMLWAARRAQAEGLSVVVGCIRPGLAPDTAALLCGLERLPARQAPCPDGGPALPEFDLDAALRRSPRLILVDEFAHINPAGSRHARRYQDVQELLNAGIDVYTTLNVQQIESLNDTVASVAGLLVRERVPDSAFDRADLVELVDLEPAELLERQAGGQALAPEKLSALRELALRRCADRASLLAESAQGQGHGTARAEEHILVCLSSSPSNARIIRTAARMARAFRGSFTALFVRTPGAAAMSPEDQERLRGNMRLAEQLGAVIETSFGDDVAYQIAEFARLSGVSKIVIGRSAATRKRLFGKPALTERLIAAAPHLDIHVIPDAGASGRPPFAGAVLRGRMPARDIGKCLLVLLAATLIGFGFQSFGFTEANIIAVYIFGVLVASIITTSRLCGLATSIVSVLVFNFFFTAPRLTFHFSDPAYLVTFTIMFMVAFLSGSLAAKLKDNASQSARAAFRTGVLFETSQLLQKEADEQSILRATAAQLTKLLRRDLVVYPAAGEKLAEPFVCRSENSRQAPLTGPGERAVAEWVLRNNKHAGAATDTLAGARCQYLAIRAGRGICGVVGIFMDGTPLDPLENSVLLSILGECALALENTKNAREKEEAAILAQNEQLRANLLRAISHDLRTPLTSISGNAGSLLANYQRMDDDARQQAFWDIYDDSIWLINLVENLLAITRIEDGRVPLSRSAELIDEVVAEALRHVDRKSREHTLRFEPPEEILLARMDAKLIVQVLINLVNNAIKYTPAGSVIEIAAKKQEGWIVVSVADDGPGIPDEQKPHIFEMFYTGASQIADSRRSLGLGLALCRSIITAHGGRITVSDRSPKGTVFTFTLPAEEVALHE